MRYRATYVVRPVGGITSDVTLEFEATCRDKAMRYARSVREPLQNALAKIDLGGEVYLHRLQWIEHPLKIQLEELVTISMIPEGVPIGP